MVNQTTWICAHCGYKDHDSSNWKDTVGRNIKCKNCKKKSYTVIDSDNWPHRLFSTYKTEKHKCLFCEETSVNSSTEMCSGCLKTFDLI